MKEVVETMCGGVVEMMHESVAGTEQGSDNPIEAEGMALVMGMMAQGQVHCLM